MADPILPQVTELNRPFWDGCAEGELRLQRCSGCGHLRFPISPTCPRCLDDGFAWESLSGRGSIFSFVVFRQGYHPYWKERLPYATALVQLDEGPRMFGDVVDADPESLEVGMPLEVTFDQATDGLSIPRFLVASR